MLRTEDWTFNPAICMGGMVVVVNTCWYVLVVVMLVDVTAVVWSWQSDKYRLSEDSPQSKPQTFYPTSHPQSLYFFRIIPVQVWYLISVWTHHFMSFIDVVNFFLLDKQKQTLAIFYQEICVKLEKVN